MKVLVVTCVFPREDRPSYGSFVKTQVDSLIRKGVKIEVLNIKGDKSKLNYLFAMYKIFWLCYRQQYDIVHAHVGWSGLAARIQFRLPLIVSFCGDDIYGHADKKGNIIPTSLFWVWCHKKLSLCVNGVIVKTRAMKELIPNKNAVVIPNGVNLREFKPMDRAYCRSQLGLSYKKIYALFPYDPCRRRKNYGEVKKAVKMLNKRNDFSVEVLIVHDVPNEQMPLYLNAADVLILASFWEGSPNAVKEALACNLRIVATDVGDVAEMISGLPGCAICESGADNIADKLYYVLTGPENTKGRHSISHLEIDKIADRVIEQYSSVINHKCR